MDIRSMLAHLLAFQHFGRSHAPKKEHPMDKPKLAIPIDVATSRPWKGLVLHHSATPDGQMRDWDGIRRYHMSWRIDFSPCKGGKEEFDRRLAAGDGKVFQQPWKDIAYHAGIEYVNGQLTFQWGRPLNQIGAHAGVKGCSNLFNVDYLGLCVVGDFDSAQPDPALWDFTLQTIRAFMDAFRFGPSKVLGHREVFERLGVPVQKSCPGRSWSMADLRASLI
jgi:hypothetical protein